MLGSPRIDWSAQFWAVECLWRLNVFARSNIGEEIELKHQQNRPFSRPVETGTHLGSCLDLQTKTHMPSSWARLVLRRYAGLATALSLTLIGACSNSPPNPNPRASEPLKTVSVDLPRYMGRWYVIANIPYFAERNFVGSYAQWRLRPDGKIDDNFFGYKKNFAAQITHVGFVDTPVPGSNNGQWSVRLFWPIYFTQLTLYVDPDYRYTILGYPGKNLAWIFSREPEMSDEVYRSLLARLDAAGYDTAQLKRVPQRPDEIGKPEFEVPGDTH